MVVTTPVVTINAIKRNTSILTSSTDAMANTWGALYNITPPDSTIHNEMLILHSPDGGSGIWDTDTYEIEFKATRNNQSVDKFMLTKSFNGNAIPTTEPVWGVSDVASITFDSGNLDNYPDDYLQAVTCVAKLADSEYENPGNDIFGTKVMLITAMPTITTASTPTSFAFINDEFTFDLVDASSTFNVTVTHDNVASPIVAELFLSNGTSVETYNTNPFTTTLTNGNYLLFYIDIPVNNNATDIAVRRVDMVVNP